MRTAGHTDMPVGTDATNAGPGLAAGVGGTAATMRAGSAGTAEPEADPRSTRYPAMSALAANAAISVAVVAGRRVRCSTIGACARRAFRREKNSGDGWICG